MNTYDTFVIAYPDGMLSTDTLFPSRELAGQYRDTDIAEAMLTDERRRAAGYTSLFIETMTRSTVVLSLSEYIARARDVARGEGYAQGFVDGDGS